jgi:hypothetical protein
MYASVRKGAIKPGSSISEVVKLIETGALPILRGIAGFKAAYIVHGDDDTFVAISLFEDRAAAEQSNLLILDWLRRNLGPMLAGPPEAMVGQVMLQG